MRMSSPVADNLGVLYSAQGDFVRAEAYLRRGLTILQATLPPDHPRIAPRFGKLCRPDGKNQSQRSSPKPAEDEVKDLRKRDLGTTSEVSRWMFRF